MTVQVVVGLDGRAHTPTAPFLRADDLAAVRGDGVFETLLVRGQVVREQEAHLARLTRSAAALGLPEPDLDAWRSVIAGVQAEWDSPEDLVVRLLLSRGPEGGGEATGWATGSGVSSEALHQRAHGVSVVCLQRGFSSDTAARAPWLLLGAKTLSYAVNMAALRHARQVGADDVVFTSSDSFVLEGPTSTVVVARGRELVTPPVEAGVLTGTTQQALFARASSAGWSTTVAPLRAAELAGADGVWLLSSVRLLARVHTVDHLPLPRADAAVALTAELNALLG